MYLFLIECKHYILANQILSRMIDFSFALGLGIGTILGMGFISLKDNLLLRLLKKEVKIIDKT